MQDKAGSQRRGSGVSKETVIKFIEHYSQNKPEGKSFFSVAKEAETKSWVWPLIGSAGVWCIQWIKLLTQVPRGRVNIDGACPLQLLLPPPLSEVSVTWNSSSGLNTPLLDR